jgi:hypothetical protein
LCRHLLDTIDSRECLKESEAPFQAAQMLDLCQVLRVWMNKEPSKPEGPLYSDVWKVIKDFDMEGESLGDWRGLKDALTACLRTNVSKSSYEAGVHGASAPLDAPASSLQTPGVRPLRFCGHPLEFPQALAARRTAFQPSETPRPRG